MYVCVCVCMCVCVRVCVNACVYACERAYVRVHVYTCVSVLCGRGGEGREDEERGDGGVPACARTRGCVLTIHRMGTADAEMPSNWRFQKLSFK